MAGIAGGLHVVILPAIGNSSYAPDYSIDPFTTAVIGGLIRSNESVTSRGVPVLMDIPLIGMLFKSNTTVKQKRELLIFLTPKIIGENTASNE